MWKKKSTLCKYSMLSGEVKKKKSRRNLYIYIFCTRICYLLFVILQKVAKILLHLCLYSNKIKTYVTIKKGWLRVLKVCCKFSVNIFKRGFYHICLFVDSSIFSTLLVQCFLYSVYPLHIHTIFIRLYPYQ